MYMRCFQPMLCDPDPLRRLAWKPYHGSASTVCQSTLQQPGDGHAARREGLHSDSDLARVTLGLAPTEAHTAFIHLANATSACIVLRSYAATPPSFSALRAPIFIRAPNFTAFTAVLRSRRY